MRRRLEYARHTCTSARVYQIDTCCTAKVPPLTHLTRVFSTTIRASGVVQPVHLVAIGVVSFAGEMVQAGAGRRLCVAWQELRLH